MATKLVIVESPTKAHKIGDYLGKGYTVMASVGHIRARCAADAHFPVADGEHTHETSPIRAHARVSHRLQ